MKRLLPAVLGLALLTSPTIAWAAETTVVLDVHHAYCSLCPSIVKSALTHTNGVKAVQVSRYAGKSTLTAAVTYDDALTSPAALIKVTTSHGYPANIDGNSTN